MLEIIALIWLWRVNGANARAKGQSTGKYRALTFALWFGLEIMGTIVGMTISTLLWPDQDPFMMSYLFGVIGAVLGGFLSYQIAKRAPQKGNAMQNEWNPNIPPVQFAENQELLQVPASIFIREELGGYGGNKDYFYLNGQPICALAPGMAFNFKTRFVRNVITIGNPYCETSDPTLVVRFIASENGMIEIHASDGKMLPELFKNYTSN